MFFLHFFLLFLYLRRLSRWGFLFLFLKFSSFFLRRKSLWFPFPEIKMEGEWKRLGRRWTIAWMKRILEYTFCALAFILRYFISHVNCSQSTGTKGNVHNAWNSILLLDSAMGRVERTSGSATISNLRWIFMVFFLWLFHYYNS